MFKLYTLHAARYCLQPVSYTHLDVYKRHGTLQLSLDSRLANKRTLPIFFTNKMCFLFFITLLPDCTYYHLLYITSHIAWILDCLI